MCKTCNYTRVKCANCNFKHASHQSNREEGLRMLERQCTKMHGILEACALPDCAPCREARRMHLHMTLASAIHAVAVCMRSCRDEQDLAARRTAAFRDWVTRQTELAGPGEECQEFLANGSFPTVGPCIGIQITGFMYSDYGLFAGQRGCCFTDSESDHGGWDNSFTWAEYLNIPSAAYFR